MSYEHLKGFQSLKRPDVAVFGNRRTKYRKGSHRKSTLKPKRLSDRKWDKSYGLNRRVMAQV